MFIAGFIITKNWKQSKCPNTDEWNINCGIIIQWNTTTQQ